VAAADVRAGTFGGTAGFAGADVLKPLLIQTVPV